MTTMQLHVSSFTLADQARTEAHAGRVAEAIKNLENAIAEWDPELAPLGDDGRPELFWPQLWEGSLMTLMDLPLCLFANTAQRETYALPLTISLDSLGESA